MTFKILPARDLPKRKGNSKGRKPLAIYAEETAFAKTSLKTGEAIEFKATDPKRAISLLRPRLRESRTGKKFGFRVIGKSRIAIVRKK